MRIGAAYVVAVWKFDRFARSVSHLLRALDTFRVLGIEFVSLSESLDTATPAIDPLADLIAKLIAQQTVDRSETPKLLPRLCRPFQGGKRPQHRRPNRRHTG